MAIALFDRATVNTCLARGVVLGNNGQEMSSLPKNYLDVTEVFDRDESNAMRWFVLDRYILAMTNELVTNVEAQMSNYDLAGT